MEPPVLVLASASPRRRRLIEWFEVPVETTAADLDEDLSGPLRSLPPILARSLAADKARAARANGVGDAIVLAFDTIVVLDGRVLGKPADVEEAREMLGSLSGGVHEVVTGVAVLRPEDTDPTTFSATTPVRMRELTSEQLEDWLASDEVLGCAGAYNIERHLAFVDEGECYQNVAGLPLCHLYRELARLGVTGLASPVCACDDARGEKCTLGPRLAGRAGLDAPVRATSASD